MAKKAMRAGAKAAPAPKPSRAPRGRATARAARKGMSAKAAPVTLGAFSESGEPLRLSRAQAKRAKEIQEAADRNPRAYMEGSRTDLP